MYRALDNVVVYVLIINYVFFCTSQTVRYLQVDNSENF